MRYIQTLILVVLIAVLSSCGTGKVLVEKKNTAETYYNSKDYASALISYKEIISIYEANDNSAQCPVYTRAGESAYLTGDAKLAIKYLKNDEIGSFGSQNTYYYLAKSYNEIDNLSLELMALSDYIEKYPHGDQMKAVKKQLFLTYVESDNYDKAMEIWPEVKANNPNNVNLVESYFQVNQSMNNDDACKVIADELLEMDPSNIVALEWKGKQYYRKAEDRYQKEMKAYDKKKTNKQYRILLKALDVVTADFKESLVYFKELYSVEPSPEYANYLNHIYNRLGDKKKSEYYKKLSD